MLKINNIKNRDKIVVVDVQDNVIAVKDKLLVHQLGLLHRAFSVMLYRYNNGILEFLLQQRAHNKYHCGGLWSNTCCSHPLLDEDVSDSAKNRLAEELIDIDGNNLSLLKIGSFIYKAEFTNGLIEHELDHVFIAEYNKLPKFFNVDEVNQLQWLSAAKINLEYNGNIDNYTPWFYQVYSMSLEYLLLTITMG